MAALIGRVLLGLLAAILFSGAAYAQSNFDPSATELSAAQTGPLPAFVPGEITVGVGPDFVATAEGRPFGLELMDTFPMRGDVAGTAPADTASADTASADLATVEAPATQTLLLRTAPGTELTEIARIGALPGVRFALPNWTVRAAFAEPSYTITDPLYAQEQWYAQRMQATRGWAWAQMQAGSLERLTRIRVAVIDSGIDFAHSDLAGRLLPGWDYVEPGTTPQDEFGHGTHMAGLIAAGFNNGRGIVGLAPAVEILPYRVLNASGGGSMTNVATAIRAATDNRARVINLSLFLDQSHPLLQDAVQYAHAQGVVIVASVGNCVLGAPCPVPVRYPAVYPETIAVGASTLQDVRAYYSATGPEVDLLAPGGDAAARILSVWPAGQSLACGEQSFRLIAGDAYCYAVGTSSAAALTSGSVALLLSVQPQLNPAQVRSALLNSAHPLPFPPDEVGAGRLDLRAALRAVLPGDLMAAPARLVETIIRPAAQVDAVTAVHGVQNPAPMTLAPPRRVVTRTVLLENPDARPVAWSATLEGGDGWVRISGPTSGLARFEQPGSVTVVISPTAAMAAMPGRFAANLHLEGQREDGSRIVQTVPIQVDVLERGRRLMFLARVTARPVQILPAQVPFGWAAPGPGGVRNVYGLTDDSVAIVNLPFTLTVQGRTFTDFRLASDGYISLPGGETDPGSANPGSPNRCLSNLIRPSHVIAPWWADLDPGAAQSRLSTFVAESGDFVVEYFNVPLAGNPATRLSFQIVLMRNGTIRFNYLDVPAFAVGNLPAATVGVSVLYNRFYRQLYCRHDQVQLGSLPGARQSFEFTATSFD